MSSINYDKLLIVDFGSQYTQLIARRVRELGVCSEVLPYNNLPETISDVKLRGIILSGGPDSVTGFDSASLPSVILSLNVPVLGICYGMQSLVAYFGGRVTGAKIKEFGHAQVTINPKSRLFASHNKKDLLNLDVWMSHGDKIDSLPAGFNITASNAATPIAAMEHAERDLYGLQFHPEVVHTPQGKAILARFVHDICAAKQHWTMNIIADNLIKDSQHKVGLQQVILGLSGGVDSSVVAALLSKAIGKQLTCVFIDTGLLRQGEVDRVVNQVGKVLAVTLIVVDAKQEFFNGLKGITDPEKKRKIIGNLFVKLFEQQAKKIPGVTWLAQGTIYSDVIESAGNKHAMGQVIKSHHNVAGLPEKMQLKLLEPLRNLFKDEVRALGLELNLSKDLLYCHPFPGPGLAVRVLGEVKPEFVKILRQADDIFLTSLRKHDLYHKIAQAFVVFLPVKSVAVMGDARSYGYVLSLRAVTSEDFMTAKWFRLPYEVLEEVSAEIINTVPGVSRVTYDISSKPPATIEWE